ncbi:MAG TPA: peptide deformylase [Anaerohalosphaeraceae bacterium]|nr:peptide deformylase [Anaerohalosphaeraceae bacterium]HPB93246.1 peptide deformylase [Anaerohalosphaeraceae bacterium]HRT23740.1 peptide deformylase [Anaerohalosphaeraceae bacterium]HRU15343.1 peptide deformylase [Anaerohalosphaeraceae bacterium]
MAAFECRMTQYPAAVLGRKARPVEKIDDSIRALAEQMKELMVEHKGVGLAGPQAGVDLRIFVVSADGTKETAKVYINPEIQVGGPLEEHEEGCLSLPGIWGKIRRYKKCTVTATDLEGRRFTEEGEGLLARAFQHEYDHLEGIMIKDRLSMAAQLRARKRLRELEEEAGQQPA